MLLYALEKTLNEDGTLRQPVTLGGALVKRERKGLTDCCELPSLEPTLVVAAVAGQQVERDFLSLKLLENLL